jgi:membrane protease subunit HflC
MKKIIIIAVLGLLVFAAFQSVYFISEWQQGLVFQFGEPIRVVRDPGLYFKVPFTLVSAKSNSRGIIPAAQNQKN